MRLSAIAASYGGFPSESREAFAALAAGFDSVLGAENLDRMSRSAAASFQISVRKQILSPILLGFLLGVVGGWRFVFLLGVRGAHSLRAVLKASGKVSLRGHIDRGGYLVAKPNALASLAVTRLWPHFGCDRVGRFCLFLGVNGNGLAVARRITLCARSTASPRPRPPPSLNLVISTSRFRPYETFLQAQ